MSNFRFDDRTPLRNRLAELEAAAEAAGQRYQVAVARLHNERASVADDAIGGDAPSRVGREVFAELADYRDDIQYRRPTAVEPDKRDLHERDLTERIVAQIRERGLVFSPNQDGWSVTLVDPSLRAAAMAADAEARDAAEAVKRFERENAAAMGEEQRAVQAQEAREWIASGDVTVAGDGSLVLTPEAKARRGVAPAAMTTQDLPGRQRVTRGA